MKIEDELLEITRSEEDQGVKFNQLVDQFRDGRDVSDLMHLLCCDNEEFISDGLYIIREIRFDFYDTPRFIEKLHELTFHVVPTIRYYAFSALFPSLNGSDPTSLELIRRHCRDANEGVREAAELTARKLGVDLV